jgi:hypothetical protein
MLSKILYGSSSILLPGLNLTATAAGSVGGRNTLAISLSGASISVKIARTGLATADIDISVPPGTTASELLAALNASPDFHSFASGNRAFGDRSAVIRPLERVHFGPPVGGLKQHIESHLGLVVIEAAAVSKPYLAHALIWPVAGRLKRDSGAIGLDHWVGSFQAGIALGESGDFETQSIVLDSLRRQLYSAVTTFDHDDLVDISAADFRFSGPWRQESSDMETPDAGVWVMGSFAIEWVEGSCEAAEPTMDQVPAGQDSGAQSLCAAGWIVSVDCASFVLSLGGQTTRTISLSPSTAGAIEAALECLDSVGHGNVEVSQVSTGRFANDYLVVFAPTVTAKAALTGVAIGGARRMSITTVDVFTSPGDVGSVLDMHIDSPRM